MYLILTILTVFKENHSYFLRQLYYLYSYTSIIEIKKVTRSIKDFAKKKIDYIHLILIVTFVLIIQKKLVLRYILYFKT